MSERLGGDEGPSTGFELPITQEHIADVLGLTAVHVNRIMQQLKAENLIAAKGRQIAVPNMAALRGVAGFDGRYPSGEPPSRAS